MGLMHHTDTPHITVEEEEEEPVSVEIKLVKKKPALTYVCVLVLFQS